MIETILLTAAVCSAIYVPLFMRTLKRERKIIEDGKKLLAQERRQFFEAIQKKAAANATIQCRTCISCHRVVHRYRPEGDGVICKECDIEKRDVA